MARTVRDSRIESRTARLKLSLNHEPYWRAIDTGMHIGYRKGARKSSWLARYHKPEGGYLKRVLGIADDTQDPDGTAILSFSQAQERARAWFAEQRKDADDVGGPYTVADAMRDYLAWYAAHRKSFRDVELRTNRFILPKLGQLDASELTTRTIRRWHEDMVKSPPLARTGKGRPQRYRAVDADDPDYERRRKASANHVLTILKAGLNHAWREGLIASDLAWQRVKPFRGVDVPRVRHLTAKECRRLINACELDFRRLVRGALLTGCRYGELTAMRCTDFRPDTQIVHVPVSKSGKPRNVPLTDEGVRFFEGVVAGRSSNAAMFVKSDGKPWGQSHQRRRLADAAKAAKIDNISFHILRHTYGSALAMNGAPMGVIAAALGHADTRITERHYAEFSPSYVATTVRASLPEFGLEDGDNVVPLKQKRAGAG